MKSIQIMLAVFCLIGTCALCQAQDRPMPEERPDLWKKVQDSMWIYLVDGDDTTDPDFVNGSYDFAMVYDSTCTITYQFTEAQHSGHGLKLLHWILGRSINAREDDLSFNSRTEDFTIVTGDTVNFFRQLYWANPITQMQNHINYFSRDTLLYVVELVRASDSTRILSLDTLGMLPRAKLGAPRVLPGQPLMAQIRYVVPQSLNGLKVFMRVRVYARGSGEYYFTRTDQFTIHMSKLLQVPGVVEWTEYAVQSGLAKDVHGEDMSGMKVMTIEQQEKTATIQLRASDIGPVSVEVHDARGERVGTLYNGMLDEARTLTHRFTSSGAYIITVLRSGVAIQSEKIIITQ